MDFKVLIADSALADLKEIIEFVAQDDADAAFRLGKKLITNALSLSAMPTRCPYYDKDRGIRKMTLKPYLIYYSCNETISIVNILHIWHSARHSPKFTK